MYYILYNPLSSNGSGKKHVARIEELLKSENEEYEVIDLVEANKGDVIGFWQDTTEENRIGDKDGKDFCNK